MSFHPPRSEAAPRGALGAVVLPADSPVGLWRAGSVRRGLTGAVVPRGRRAPPARARRTTTPSMPLSSACRQSPAAPGSGEAQPARSANGRRAPGGRRGALWEWRLFQDGGGGRRAGRRRLLEPGQYPSVGRRQLGGPAAGASVPGLCRDGGAWAAGVSAGVPGRGSGPGGRCGGERGGRVLAGKAVSWGGRPGLSGQVAEAPALGFWCGGGRGRRGAVGRVELYGRGTAGLGARPGEGGWACACAQGAESCVGFESLGGLQENGGLGVHLLCDPAVKSGGGKYVGNGGTGFRL